MPSTKPKCPNCGELLQIEISYGSANNECVTGGTRSTSSANNVKRICKKCGSLIFF